MEQKKLNRGKILTLIHDKVSYSNIAKLFGIAKSTVAYIKKQAMDNKKTKSRLIDGTLYDFDAGVASVLLSSTTTSSEQQVVSKKVVKAAAITFAERIGCKKFKASDGWADKFMRRNFPELKTAMTGTKSMKRQNAPQTIETDGCSNPAHTLQPVANIFECIVPGTEDTLGGEFNTQPFHTSDCVELQAFSSFPEGVDEPDAIYFDSPPLTDSFWDTIESLQAEVAGVMNNSTDLYMPVEEAQ